MVAPITRRFPLPPLAALLAVLALVTGRSALAAETPQQKCTAAKLKAIGREESGLLRCQSRVATTNDVSG